VKLSPAASPSAFSPLTVETALEKLGFTKKTRQWKTPGALALEMDPVHVRQSPALEAIDAALVDVVDNPESPNKLMIFMPPQEGKSERASHRFPEWLLADNKDLRIAIVSYTDEMARRWGAEIKRDAISYTGVEGTVDLGIRLRDDSQAAGRWAVQGGIGSVYCCGIRGSLTGKPADIIIIDDPVKDLETARSPANREAAWGFWTSVVIPRMGPHTKVVLIQTRWHEDDLAGRILKHEGSEWTVLSIPAISEGGQDPLGRPEGVPMESVRGDRDWARTRRNVGEYVWAALYQQRPAPQAGGLFKTEKMKYWRALPSVPGGTGLRLQLGDRIIPLQDCWRFITCDLAASTKTSADWTVAAAWAVTNDSDLVLLDRFRDRIEESDHWSHINPLRQKWGVDIVFVESAMYGTTMVIDATQAGVPLSELKADTDKFTRAIPASARMDAGKVWFPAMVSWMSDWTLELISFPNGAHDDQVDVFAYAARAVAAHWVQPEFGRRASTSTPSSSVAEEAFASATGGGHLRLVASDGSASW
jgi:predicted phage terminase large subunit-like protein